jgi:hypothetical protein
MPTYSQDWPRCDGIHHDLVTKMGISARILRAGDEVEVKSQLEIAQTLDIDGTLDGLPFMPEMAELCGRRFRVLRRAEKTCVEIAPGDYQIREFLGNDVFLLEGLRCSGAHHDGCQRLCMFFWKAAWLRSADGSERSPADDGAAFEVLRAKQRTTTALGRYFCQSTQLHKSTRPEPLTKGEIALKCFRDVRSGAVGVWEMVPLVLLPLYRKIRDRVSDRPRLVGPLTRTPVGALQLQRGELVEIKSLEEMTETLDVRGRNRGLVCDIELKALCGSQYRVLGRLDRMISEPTGEMRKVEATVILGNTCMCARVVGGCPRQDYCYWRELWLRRVEPFPTSKIQEAPADREQGSTSTSLQVAR